MRTLEFDHFDRLLISDRPDFESEHFSRLHDAILEGVEVPGIVIGRLPINLWRRAYHIILDGNHRAVACCLSSRPARCYELETNRDKHILCEFVAEDVVSVPLRRFMTGKQSLRQLMEEALWHAGRKCSLVSVEEHCAGVEMRKQSARIPVLDERLTHLVKLLEGSFLDEVNNRGEFGCTQEELSELFGVCSPIEYESVVRELQEASCLRYLYTATEGDDTQRRVMTYWTLPYLDIPLD